MLWKIINSTIWTDFLSFISNRNWTLPFPLARLYAVCIRCTVIITLFRPEIRWGQISRLLGQPWRDFESSCCQHSKRRLYCWLMTKRGRWMRIASRDENLIYCSLPIKSIDIISMALTTSLYDSASVLTAVIVWGRTDALSKTAHSEIAEHWRQEFEIHNVPYSTKSKGASRLKTRAQERSNSCSCWTRYAGLLRFCLAIKKTIDQIHD